MRPKLETPEKNNPTTHRQNYPTSRRQNLAFLYPLVTNGLSHPYHSDESTFIFWSSGSDLSFSFSEENHESKQIAPDGTPRFAASHLGIFCLPMSHKKGARLIWVNCDLSETHTHSGETIKHVRALDGPDLICQKTWTSRPVCVEPGQKPRTQTFS